MSGTIDFEKRRAAKQEQERKAAAGAKPLDLRNALRSAVDFRNRQNAIADAENAARGGPRDAHDVADVRSRARELHALTDRERGVVMAAGFNPAGDDVWHSRPDAPYTPDDELARSVSDTIERQKSAALEVLADRDAEPIDRAVAWLQLANALGIPVSEVDGVQVHVAQRINTERLHPEETRAKLLAGNEGKTQFEQWSKPLYEDEGLPPAIRALKLMAHGQSTGDMLQIMTALLLEVTEGRSVTDNEHEAIRVLVNHGVSAYRDWSRGSAGGGPEPAG